MTATCTNFCTSIGLEPNYGARARMGGGPLLSALTRRSRYLIGAVESESAAWGASARQNAVRGRATASKLFSKPFQIWAVFLQAFPKKALAVLWDFNGLQGFQTQ